MADAIRRSSEGTPSIQAERPNNWTAAKRATFLDHLAATCNVTKASEATGVPKHMAYALRRRDTGFAEQWRAALLTGYDRLEAKLIEHALAALGETEHGEVGEGPFDPKAAMEILKLYYARLHQGVPVTRGGPPPKRATPEETDTAILRQLAVLERRRKANVA